VLLVCGVVAVGAGAWVVVVLLDVAGREVDVVVLVGWERWWWRCGVRRVFA
jgi:hypothetical protein